MVWGGDHCSPGYFGLRSQRGSQRRPPRPDPPGQSRLHPCPGCTTQPVGPQLLSSSSGHCNPGSPAASLLHPLFWALARPLTTPWAPRRPRPVTRICISTSQPEKRTGALLHTAPLRFCMDGANRTSSRPRMASVDQAAQGLRSTFPFAPLFSLIGLAWLWEEEAGNIKACH